MLTKYEEFPLIVFLIMKQEIIEDILSPMPLFPRDVIYEQYRDLTTECAFFFN